MKRSHTISGVLYETRDSSVVVSTRSIQSSEIPGTGSAADVWSKDIKQIDLRKKGTEGTSVLIGGIAGLVTGLIIGILSAKPGSGSDPSQHFETGKMIVFPLLFAGIGAGIGGTVGGAKIKIPIKGSQAEFERNRYRLEGYSVKKQPYGSVRGEGYFTRLTDTLTDVDGNVYHLLALGGQVWIAENLKVTRFRDSTAIPATSLRKLSNDIHYNRSAVADERNICPSGWHVPLHADWMSLSNSLGGEDNAARRLEGIFTPKGWSAQWWSSTEHPGIAGCFFVNGEEERAVYTVQPETSFMPVRCIRD
jgi:hypothetical protein